MTASSTPKGMRLHIGFYGRRNAGKSSLLNALTRQRVSIVSETPGTTTDPVEKPMELLPLGPVLFLDTAGVDDEGDLGRQRVERTKKVLDRTDLAILVAASGEWTSYEEDLWRDFLHRKLPTVVVFNKCDLGTAALTLMERIRTEAQLHGTTVRIVETNARASGLNPDADMRETVGQLQNGLSEFRQALLDVVPDELLETPPILSDLLLPGQVAVLVVPVDKEAPRGRLILPQVQAIRDLLDAGRMCMVTRDSELISTLTALNAAPGLVVTDSQAFRKVSEVVPPEVPLTGFSLLFARMKGDLGTFIKGALSVNTLRPGDKILVAESCTHHPSCEDIGRVKIPNWLEKRVGGKLNFTHVQGNDFPDDLSPYKLVIHCGGCMTNRRAILARIMHCSQQGIPITNYGILISFCLGLLERAIKPFKIALSDSI